MNSLCCWVLGCYKAPCRVNNSRPLAFKRECPGLSCHLHKSLGFWFPSLCSSLLPLLVCSYWTFSTKVRCIKFSTFIQPFLKTTLSTLRNFCYPFQSCTPTFTSPPLIGGSRAESSGSPNKAWIQQALGGRLTSLPAHDWSSSTTHQNFALWFNSTLHIAQAWPCHVVPGKCWKQTWL